MRKDYYELLQVFPGSSADEIKRSYRKLAQKYHPDKNPQNVEASLHFRDLVEAYSVLSEPTSRYNYDKEYGFDSEEARKIPTPQRIYSDASRLRRYVYNLSSFRPDQVSLLFQIKKVLSDTNLQVLKQANEPAINRLIINDLLDASKLLQYRYLPEVMERFKKLAEDDHASLDTVNQYAKNRKRHHYWDLYMPLLVFILTILICLLIYLLST